MTLESESARQQEQSPAQILQILTFIAGCFFSSLGIAVFSRAAVLAFRAHPGVFKNKQIRTIVELLQIIAGKSSGFLRYSKR